MVARSDENPSITVRRAAMNLLARREQSFHELLEKMCRKFPDFDQQDIILPALERLREEKLQSDERFVDSYVRYRYSRGIGPLKIGMELGQKGVNSRLANAALAAGDIDWDALCREAMARRFSQAPPASLQEKEKRYRFLSQRGFDGDQIRRAMAGTDYD